MTLTRTERLGIAEFIKDELVHDYGDDILLGGIFGSVARGEDTPYSDLETIFIVKDSCEASGFETLFNEVLISYDIHKIGYVEGCIQNPSMNWPFQYNTFTNFKLIHGDKRALEGLRELGKRVPYEDFLEVVQKHLYAVWDTVEKIKKYKERGLSKRQVICLKNSLMHDVNTQLALLNREGFKRNHYGRFEQGFEFNNRPEDYKRIIKELHMIKSVERMKELSVELFNNYYTLVKRKGITLNECDKLNGFKF